MLLKLHRGSFLEDTLPITLASSSPALTLSRPTAPHLLHPRDLSASRSLPLILAKPPCGAYYSQEPYFQDHVLLLNSTHHDTCVGEVGTHLVPIACLCCQDPKGCSVCGLVAEVRPPSNERGNQPKCWGKQKTCPDKGNLQEPHFFLQEKAGLAMKVHSMNKKAAVEQNRTSSSLHPQG